jgi:hypothetical protein
MSRGLKISEVFVPHPIRPKYITITGAKCSPNPSQREIEAKTTSKNKTKINQNQNKQTNIKTVGDLEFLHGESLKAFQKSTEIMKR